MKYQGRDAHAVVATVLLMILFLHCKNAQAATYTVGDASIWSFNTEGWTEGKTFNAGDVLVFNYSPESHNVVVVDKQGYDTRKASEGEKIFQTGSDQITLVQGQTYFICSFPGHCESNMKIAVNAL